MNSGDVRRQTIALFLTEVARSDWVPASRTADVLQLWRDHPREPGESDVAWMVRVAEILARVADDERG